MLIILSEACYLYGNSTTACLSNKYLLASE